MSGISGKNTKPEVVIRSQLHRLGFRFRLHDKKLPGEPDLVLNKYQSVIFVHGCFWHRHECYLFKWPKTREKFWRTKINKNYKNDQKAVESLRKQGWRVCVVWECAIKGPKKREIPNIAVTIAEWLTGDKEKLELSG